MLKLEVDNFLGITHAELEDESAFSVIVGANNSGKSSLASAVEYVFTGGACGLRGQGVSNLIRQGRTRMKVSLEVGQWNLARTKTSGVSQGEIANGFGIVPDGLPLLFNHRHCLEGGSRLMRALLDSVSNDSGDLSRFVTDDDMRRRLTTAQAKNPGSVNKLIAACEEERKIHRAPGEPLAPNCAEPAPDVLLCLEATRNEAAIAHSRVLEKLHSANADLAVLGNCKRYFEALALYQAALSVSAEDPLGERRVSLRGVANLCVSAMGGWGRQLADSGFSAEAEALAAVHKTVEAAVTHAKEMLATHPAPRTIGPEPVLRPETEARLQMLDEYSLAGVENEISKVTHLKDALVTEERSAAGVLASVQEEIDTLAAHNAQWTVYRSSIASLAETRYRIETEWNGWDALIKVLQAYQEQKRRAVQEKILGRVEEFGGSVLSGRRVALDTEGEITIDGRTLETASGSERWRISVCVMAAIAAYLRSPILVLDGADILDDRNKVALVRFLAEKIVPYFSHTLLLTTIRGDGRDEKPLSFDASKWIIKGGTLFKIAKAARQAQGVLAGLSA